MPGSLFGDAQLANAFTVLGSSATPIMGMTEQQLLQQILVATANRSGGGGGTVTEFSFTDDNGIAGVVTTSTTTPNLTLSLGNITPSRITTSTAGVASTPPWSLTGTWFSGGSATTTKPQLLVEPAGTTSNNWSTSGTGLGVNAASGFGGNLLDAQLNGVRRFQVDYQGNLSCGGFTSNTGSITLQGADRAGFLGYNPYGNGFAINGIYNSGSLVLGDGPGTTVYGHFVGLSNNALGLRPNTNATQKLSVFSSTDTATNYEAVSVVATAGGDAELVTSAGGTGTRRNIQLNGANRAAYDASPSTTTIRDILISHGLMATP